MRRVSVMLLLLLIATAGCTRSAITVDDEKISKEAFDLALKERLDSHKALNAKIDEKAVKKAVADELVAQALLVREAKAKKITVTDEEVQKVIAEIRGGASEQEFKEGLQKKGIPYNILQDRVRNNLLISKLMASLVKDDSVTDEMMKDLYAKSTVPFMRHEKELVKILQINTEADAKKALEELKKGADFDTLAKNLTDAGNATASDYGWIDPDTFPSKDLATAMKTAKINVFSGPHKGADGSYYIFRVKERQAAGVIPYEEAKPQIKNMLLNQKKRDLARQIIETNRKTAKIKINI